MTEAIVVALITAGLPTLATAITAVCQSRTQKRNASATSPSTLRLISGGTFAAGGWIKVWGWNN